MSRWDHRAFLPDEAFRRITDLRVDEPDTALDHIRRRVRPTGTPRPFVVLAADHPARMVTAVGDDPVRMADRHEYLARVARVLAGSPVHGLMATADVIEEVALLDVLAREHGHGGMLDGRHLVGSVNRGGLEGFHHGLFDPATAYRDLEFARDLGLDGVKILVRVPDPGPHDGEAIAALARVAGWIDEARRLGLRVYLEPLAVVMTDAGPRPTTAPDAMARALSVASGLGSSGMHVWLKVPGTDGFARVAAATTHPLLLLGGPETDDPVATIEALVARTVAAPNVRGALMGRPLLYPGDHDPAAVAAACVAALAARSPAPVAAAGAPPEGWWG